MRFILVLSNFSFNIFNLVIFLKENVQIVHNIAKLVLLLINAMFVIQQLVSFKEEFATTNYKDVKVIVWSTVQLM